MSEIDKNVEGSEEATEVDTKVEAKETDTTDWKAEASKFKRMAEQRGKKLEKYASVKDEDETGEQQPQDKTPQSNESDYGRLATRAYLKAEGITHPDDQKVVMDEAKRLKLNVDDVAGMEHIKSRIQANQDQRSAETGISVKGGKRTGGATQHDVDYWLARPDERPSDHAMAVKVLQAKQAKEASANQFSDVMYND